jgi:hypothetical protein
MGTEAHYIQTLSKWADIGPLTDRTTQEKRRQTRFTDPGTPQRLTPERVVSGERVPILTLEQAFDRESVTAVTDLATRRV